MKIQLGEADIKVLPLYRCSKCGSEKAGDTVRLGRMKFTDPKQLVDHIERYKAGASHMPVGWSSNLHGILCEKCK